MHSTTSSLQVSATDRSEARSRRGTRLVEALEPKCSSDPEDPVGLAPFSSPPSPAVIASGAALLEEAVRLWACWNALPTSSTKVSTPPCMTNRRTLAGWLSMQTRTNWGWTYRFLRRSAVGACTNVVAGKRGAGDERNGKDAQQVRNNRAGGGNHSLVLGGDKAVEKTATNKATTKTPERCHGKKGTLTALRRTCTAA